MKVVIGSKNPVKVQAVREVLSDYALFKEAEFVGRSVDSGVADQPHSLAEMIEGAKNRAKSAFDKGDYGVGIESGLYAADGTVTGYLESTICVIFDGKHYAIGNSPSFEVPPKVFALVQQGLDLSEACYRAGLSEDAKIGEKQGIVGLLTKGRKTRQDYSQDAIIMAMIQLENENLYS